LEENRVLVPFRKIFEALDGEVAWVQNGQNVLGKKGYSLISLHIGSKKASTNKGEIELDVPPQIKNSRTLVPLRFVAESLGAKVNWDDAEKTVFISSDKQSDSNQDIPDSTDNKISMNAGEGSKTSVISDGETKSFDIDAEITPDNLVVLSLCNLGSNKGHFNYLTLKNKTTGQIVGYESSAAAEGGWVERSRIRYFRTSDAVNKRYSVIVSTPNNGYSGQFTVNVKVVNRMSFVNEDSHGNQFSADEYGLSGNPLSDDTTPKTYCISSDPEMISDKPQDVLYYGAREKSAELGENGFYLQRSPVNRNANIFWEHINMYGKDMKYGVLLWNNEPKPLEIKLNSRSFYGSEINNSKTNCSTKIWLERALGEKSLNRDEVDSYYQGFGPDLTITIPGYNSDDPSASAKWICLYTVKGFNTFSYFNGVMDISITDMNGNKYAGQNLYCDTYVMNTDSGNKIPNHETTRLNVSKAQRAFGDMGFRGSGSSAILEAHIKETIKVTDSKPFNFIIGGVDVPLLNQNEMITIKDIVSPSSAKTNYLEDYPKSGSTKITADDIREINARKNSGNYGVIYKVSFNKLESDKPIKGKIKFNPKVSACFNDFHLYEGFPNLLVAVYDGKGNSYEAQLTRRYSLSKPIIEAVFNADVPHGNGPSTFYFVMGGMGNMPVEVSFEN
ncbi:MAG TPA: copper amine oxidase N-terminal domain-containing protein, partial [Clostridia bacterium]